MSAPPTIEQLITGIQGLFRPTPEDIELCNMFERMLRLDGARFATISDYPYPKMPPLPLTSQWNKANLPRVYNPSKSKSKSNTQKNNPGMDDELPKSSKSSDKGKKSSLTSKEDSAPEGQINLHHSDPEQTDPPPRKSPEVFLNQAVPSQGSETEEDIDTASPDEAEHSASTASIHGSNDVQPTNPMPAHSPRQREKPRRSRRLRSRGKQREPKKKVTKPKLRRFVLRSDFDGLVLRDAYCVFWCWANTGILDYGVLNRRIPRVPIDREAMMRFHKMYELWRNWDI